MISAMIATTRHYPVHNPAMKLTKNHNNNNGKIMKEQQELDKAMHKHHPYLPIFAAKWSGYKKQQKSTRMINTRKGKIMHH